MALLCLGCPSSLGPRCKRAETTESPTPLALPAPHREQDHRVPRLQSAKQHPMELQRSWHRCAVRPLAAAVSEAATWILYDQGDGETQQ